MPPTVYAFKYSVLCVKFRLNTEEERNCQETICTQPDPGGQIKFRTARWKIG